MCALAPNTFVAPSTKTIVTLCHLHPLAKVDLPPFVNNFHPETNLVLEKETFIFTLTCFHISHLMVPQVWCMNFCGIILTLMTLLVALIFFKNMWAHHLWSCSSINITLACCIAVISFGETNRRYLPL